MNFDEAFDALIDHEGGYVNDPNDPGGETKFGISKRSYPHLDIRSLTLQDAKAIYLRDFWGRLQLQELPEPVRFQMFDAAVNHGPGNAARFLQRAVDVADDGYVGPVTIEATKLFTPYELLARFNGERLMFFTKLSTWKHHGKGWARRIAKNLLLERSGIELQIDDDDGWFTDNTTPIYNVMVSSEAPLKITEGENV